MYVYYVVVLVVSAIASGAAASIWRHFVAGQRAPSSPSIVSLFCNSNLDGVGFRTRAVLSAGTDPPAGASKFTHATRCLHEVWLPSLFAPPGERWHRSAVSRVDTIPSNSKSCYFFPATKLSREFELPRTSTRRTLASQNGPVPLKVPAHHPAITQKPSVQIERQYVVL